MASSITILLGITFFGAVAFTSDDFKISKSLDVFFTLFRELDIFYVDKIDPEKLVNTGINAMWSSLMFSRCKSILPIIERLDDNGFFIIKLMDFIDIKKLMSSPSIAGELILSI